MRPNPNKRRECFRRQRVRVGVVALLFIHASLLAYSATCHSPTLNEPGHLVAGLRIWKHRRYELYRVNPPLTKMIAALPVLAAGCEEDWSGLYEYPGARPVFDVGADFIAANGVRSRWLFTIARWACIPLSLMGGLFCFMWSQELWQSNAAGFVSLALWCLEPNIVAHAELITPDCAAASCGVGAAWLFWRWLKRPTWSRAAAAGVLLGMAQLAKMTWVILLPLWPLLWSSHILFKRSPAADHEHRISRSAGQLSVILLTAVYVLNLAYAFDGTCTRLKDYRFISRTFIGNDEPGEIGNRFADSWIGKIPVPLPRQYLLGMDVQKSDFEDYPNPSYLCGEWKYGGWWYYYLIGLLVKTPHSLQALLLLSCWLLLMKRTTTPQSTSRQLRHDLCVLLTPALAVLILVSSQTAMNHHFRYILPSFGFMFVFCGIAGR